MANLKLNYAYIENNLANLKLSHTYIENNVYFLVCIGYIKAK